MRQITTGDMTLQMNNDSSELPSSIHTEENNVNGEPRPIHLG